MASKNKKLSMAADIFSNSIEGVIRKIPMNNIIPDKGQPRKNRDINIEALANSLREEGLLQPIVVNKENNHYSIIAGERRFRAAKSLGWKEIECKIINKNDKDKFRLAVIENSQRENLDPIEEAQAFKQLKNLFSHTDSDLAKVIGKSRNYVSEILSIAEIPSIWIERAYKLHINSRNMLVQYAQAIKINQADNFLSDFQAGNISTVKDAKNFIQQAKRNLSFAQDKEEIIIDKTNQFSQNENTISFSDTRTETIDTNQSFKKQSKINRYQVATKEKSANNTEVIENQNLFSVTSSWSSEKKISIELQFQELPSFTLENLEKSIKESLRILLANTNNT